MIVKIIDELMTPIFECFFNLLRLVATIVLQKALNILAFCLLQIYAADSNNLKY